MKELKCQIWYKGSVRQFFVVVFKKKILNRSSIHKLLGWIFIQWPVSYWNHSPQIWWRGWGGITTYESLRLSATMEAKLRAQHKQWDFQKSFLKWIYLLILHTHSGAKYEFLLCLTFNYDHGRQTGLKSRGATKIRDLFSKNYVFW